MSEHKAYRRMNPLETTRAVTLLEQHFDKAKEAYHDSWNDERIAKESGNGVTVGAVGQLRHKYFGKLRITRKTSEILTKQLEQQTMIDWLCDELSKTQQDLRDTIIVVRNLAPSAMSNQLLKAILERYPDKASIRSATTPLATKS